MANTLIINISNTGLVTGYSNLNINQNSTDNCLVLNATSNYDWVEYYFTRPDGYITSKAHMVKQGYDNDSKVYIYYLDIPKAITSFTMFKSIENLKVSFICYKVNDDIAVSTSVSSVNIAVTKVDNTEVIDQTYNGNDVNSIWTKLGELTDKVSILDPTDNGEALDKLNSSLASLQSEVNSISNQLENNPYYSKDEVDSKVSAIYRIQGSVEHFADLPTSSMSNSTIGYVYNVTDSGINYVWTSEGWDSLGTDIDTTKYYTKTEIDSTVSSLNSKINSNNGKISTVQGDLNSYKTTNNEAITEIKNDLSDNYYTKSDVYNKEEVNAKLSSVLKYKGSLANYEAITNVTNPSIGDTYNAADTGVNYAWNGDVWDPLGADIDLSNYYTRDEVDTKVADFVTKNNVYTTSQIDSKITTINTTTDNLTTRISNISSNLSALSTKVDNNNENANTAINNAITNCKAYTDNAISNVNATAVYIRDWRVS